jgi:RNA polymerase I-specific transcription initiation factor RRN6
MINTENDNEEQAEDLQSRKEDGWARTMWVGDANTLLVCNRKRIDLIDLRQPSRPLNVPQVLDERSVKHSYQPWILDVKRHPLLDEKQFFVLTSTRLYLFSATFDEQRGNFDDTDASIVLSWTHFRGTQDVTLQLFTQSISDEGMLVPQPILLTH